MRSFRLTGLCFCALIAVLPFTMGQGCLPPAIPPGDSDDTEMPAMGAELPAPEDEDVLQAPALETGPNLPPAVDLTPGLPPVWDQKHLGACSAFVAAALATYETHCCGVFAGDASEQASPGWLYPISLAREGKDCSSTTKLKNSMIILKKTGCGSWAVAPYDGETCATNPNSSDAAKFRIVDYGVLSPTVNDVRSKLAQGRVVAFGTHLYVSFTKLRNFTDVYTGSGDFVLDPGGAKTGHAMLVVGYDDARQAFRIRNSWGPQWADGGYVWMAYSTFAETALCAYYGYASPSPGSGPTPTPESYNLAVGSDAVIAPTQVQEGGAMSITVSVKNTGSQPVGQFAVAFVLSRDPDLSNGSFLGASAVDALAGGGETQTTWTGNLPTDVTAGEWYLGWRIDPDQVVPEIDRSDNIALRRAPVTVVARPANTDGVNLVTGSNPPTGGGSNKVFVGAKTSLSVPVRNTGARAGSGFTVSLYLSDDARLDPSHDTFLASKCQGDIGPGGCAIVNIEYVPPARLRSGSYYIGWIIDSANTVEESDENDNSYVEPNPTSFKGVENHRDRIFYGSDPPVWLEVSGSTVNGWLDDQGIWLVEYATFDASGNMDVSLYRQGLTGDVIRAIRLTGQLGANSICGDKYSTPYFKPDDLGYDGPWCAREVP